MLFMTLGDPSMARAQVPGATGFRTVEAAADALDCPAVQLCGDMDFTGEVGVGLELQLLLHELVIGLGGTSRVHRPKHETKALRVEDLVEIRAAVRRWVNADRPGPKATGDIADVIDLMLATGCRVGEILALRWSDLDLDGDLLILTVSGTIKTETGKGTYRKPTPKSDASRRTVVLPRFAAELLRVRREFATPNEHDAVFATRNGT
jgi:integrase